MNKITRDDTEHGVEYVRADEAQAEVLEQCRINGMSAEREDALRAEIKRLKAAQPAPVQDLPFGVGGGLVAIKTLLGRDPCVHANTAIEMIDAILKEQPAAQPAVQEPVEVDQATMELAESVGLIGPASRTHDLHAAIQRFHDLICVNATIKAAKMAADAIRESTPPAAQRQWVGLTDKERNQLWRDVVKWGDPSHDDVDLMKAIEDKLKERNT
jgi:hypothetical protein